MQRPGLRYLWCAAVFAAIALQGAPAQAEARRVVLVVDSLESAGVATLKAELARHAGVKVLSLHEAATRGETPRVMIAVAGTRGGKVSVYYWDVAGTVDTLAASTTKAPGQLEVVASILASALLQKHDLAKRDPLDNAPSSRCEAERMLAELTARALPVLSSLPRRRTLKMAIDDF